MQNLSRFRKSGQPVILKNVTELIEESFGILYNTKEGTELRKLAEQQIEDLNNNPRETRQLSENLMVLKDMVAGKITFREGTATTASGYKLGLKKGEVDPIEEVELDTDGEPVDECDDPKPPRRRKIKKEARKMGETRFGMPAASVKKSLKEDYDEDDEYEDDDFGSDYYDDEPGQRGGDDGKPLTLKDVQRFERLGDRELDEEQYEDQQEVAEGLGLGDPRDLMFLDMDEWGPAYEKVSKLVKEHGKSLGKGGGMGTAIEYFELGGVKFALQGSWGYYSVFANAKSTAEIWKAIASTGAVTESRKPTRRRESKKAPAKKKVFDSKKVSKSLKNFRESSAGKAFYKNLKKFVEGGQVSDLDLYKAVNSALTQLAIELEHNSSFRETYAAISRPLARDVRRLHESFMAGKVKQSLYEGLKTISKFLMEDSDDKEDLEALADWAEDEEDSAEVEAPDDEEGYDEEDEEEEYEDEPSLTDVVDDKLGQLEVPEEDLDTLEDPEETSELEELDDEEVRALKKYLYVIRHEDELPEENPEDAVDEEDFEGEDLSEPTEEELDKLESRLIEMRKSRKPIKEAADAKTKARLLARWYQRNPEVKKKVDAALKTQFLRPGELYDYLLSKPDKVESLYAQVDGYNESFKAPAKKPIKEGFKPRVTNYRAPGSKPIKEGKNPVNRRRPLRKK